MSTTITKGTERNALSRIYDRLRKRSQRRHKAKQDWPHLPRAGGRQGFTNDFLPPWGLADHEAYILGVRDALNAVEEAGLLVPEYQPVPNWPYYLNELEVIG